MASDPRDPRVEQVMARLLPLDMIGEMFPPGRPYCLCSGHSSDGLGRYCTRPIEHTGPHVAHRLHHDHPRVVAVAIWWDA